MNITAVENKFEKIGARVRTRIGSSTDWFGRPTSPITLDVQRDARGKEFFDIVIRGGDVQVLDAQPEDRHLLLLSRSETGEKAKYLCGHDERHWFVAAIPESAPVGTVRQAKAALKPAEIVAEENRRGLKAWKRNRRHNEVYIRQGEWFFIPAPDVQANEDLIVKNEPITRGRGSKSHMVQECYRSGGQTVMVCSKHPTGIAQEKYNAIIRKDPSAKTWGWRQMVRDANVYVRGTVRHDDHATILLEGWHRVVMNTENQAAAMRHVAFLD